MSSGTYTTVQGDTWDMIAFKVWGDEKKVAQLLTANPSLQGVFIFEAGVALVVPDIVQVKKEPVPPWQR